MASDVKQDEAPRASAPFVHLHNHSDMSLLDGACRIGDLVQRAVDFGMPSIALTDHGNLFGRTPFFRAAS